MDARLKICWITVVGEEGREGWLKSCSLCGGKLGNFEKRIREEAKASLAAHCVGRGSGGGGAGRIMAWRKGDAVAEVSYGNLRTESCFKIIFRKLVCMVASC